MAAPLTPRISLTERISTAAVRVIRHPLFVVAYCSATAFWWLSHPPANGWANAFNDDAFPWPMWTSLASLLALLIESAVGIGQYYAGKRDAVQAARTAELMRATAAQSEAIVALLREVREALRHGEGEGDDDAR